jgi:hypothetical protein
MGQSEAISEDVELDEKGEGENEMETETVEPERTSQKFASTKCETLHSKELHWTKDSKLRELGKEAYSPSNLHKYKSDPLHRRKGPLSSGNGGDTRPLPQGRRGHSFGGRGRGRGQPNMKLRMNFMLEKIKRNFT